jgi:hypothetical protein
LNIVGWLRRIGLAQYAEAFRASDIDGDPLSRLTNDDLKDIGVARGAIAFTIAACYSNSRASCAMQGLSVMSILSGVTAMHPPSSTARSVASDAFTAPRGR